MGYYCKTDVTTKNHGNFFNSYIINVYNHHSSVFSNRFDILLHIALILCHIVQELYSERCIRNGSCIHSNHLDRLETEQRLSKSYHFN